MLYAKLSFGLFILTWNVSYKNAKRNPFIKNLMGTKDRYICVTTNNSYTINLLWSIISNSCSFIA